MTSQPGKQTISIHILHNISRNKGNQIMKFGQLIKCNMRKIFFEKSYRKCCGETIPRHFYKKPKLSISLNKSSKILHSLFLLYGKLTAIKIYWKYVADHLVLNHIKLFQKTKRTVKLVPLPHFLHDFWRQILLLLYSTNLLNFIVRLTLLREILGNMCIVIVC